MFDNKGYNGPPCGVPAAVGLTNPFSNTPAVRNARSNFKRRLSLIRFARVAISLS